jgi:ketosteroid isomerase-like protein
MIVGVMVAMPAGAADESNLAARVVTWEKEYNADGLKKVAAMYAEDGCRMPPNQATVHGREGILAQLEAGKKQGIARVKLALTSVQSRGDLAYGTGTYEILTAEGTKVDQGKWMNVSKKVGGEWTIQCDMYNSDQPLEAGKK